MADTKMGTDTPRKMRHTIVPLPKIVFFYPLMITCILCAFIETYNGAEPSKEAGTLFVAVFLVNILIISFDFPGVKAVALAAGLIALLFGLLWLDSRYEGKILGPLADITKILFEKVHASTMFYCLISSIFALMIFMGIVANYLWNRWVIENDRIYHKHGILGDITEYPVIDLQVQKSIDDVFEYGLLLSGTLTFSVPNAPTIRLENVPFINRIEKKIQNIVRKSYK